MNTSRKLAALLIVSAGSVRAIDPHRAMSQYVRDRWGVEQGFPRGSVYAIAQTYDGYLWIGTEAGLLRFDGLHFRTMRGHSTFSLTSVLGLAADADGSLWIQMLDRTLLRYRNGDLEDPSAGHTGVANITTIARDNDGQLLAARMQEGAFTWRGGGLSLLAPARGIPRSPIISIAQTGDGAVWMGTRGAGLFRLSGGATTAVWKGLPDLKVNCLLPDGKDGLWIGTDDGVARWDGRQLSTAGMPEALHGLQILAMAKDRDANLWVGTDTGRLFRINSDGVESLYRDPAESGSAITALFEDREGSIWIGSANSVERLRDSPFVTWSLPERLPTDGSNPVLVDSQGRTWFPPVSGGLWWFRGDKYGKVAGAGLDRDIVYSLAGGKDELWVGRQRGGLTRLSLRSGSFDARTYTAANGLAQGSVYSVYVAGDGAVWAGTLSGGVSRLDRGKLTTYTVADGLVSNTVASILESSDGTMWFATPLGISSLAGGRWRTYSSANGLPSENVNCLLQDSSGLLWAGTTQGMAVFRNGKFEAIGPAPASLREQILGIAEDKAGAFWIATSNHVLRAGRAALLQGVVADAAVREFGLADGLRGTEGVKRHRSVIADFEGRIWMSLNRGISSVDPARLSLSSAPAIPQIQTISADGVTIPANGAVRVPAGARRIVFDYAGLSLARPDRVRFRYRLEGFENNWSEPVAEPQATYTGLGPSSYRFRLMATNPDGVWSAGEASLAFQVDPAWWQTWWFRGSLVLAIGLTAVALYRLRLLQLTARLNGRFEERLAERTRIAQELHDTLLQGFLSASMQLHVATSRLPDDSELKPGLTRTLDLMRKVIEEGRNAVRGLRATRSASMDLEEAFSRIQDEMAQGTEWGQSVGFRVIAEGPRMALHPVLRDEVYRIGREGLINAFRHSRAKNIEIELKYSPGAFHVAVRDDGCGIDPEILKAGREGHWGLSGMRERADRIGGRLRLWSRANGGTELELIIPGHIAFRSRSKEKKRGEEIAREKETIQ